MQAWLWFIEASSQPLNKRVRQKCWGVDRVSCATVALKQAIEFLRSIDMGIFHKAYVPSRTYNDSM